MERKTKQLEGKVNNTKYQSYVIQTQELKQDMEKNRNNLEELKIVLKNKENFNEIITEEEVKFMYRMFNLNLDLFFKLIIFINCQFLYFNSTNRF